MKIDPIELITKEKINLSKNLYLISGNEITLIRKIKDILTKYFITKNDGIVENIDSLINYRESGSLFHSAKILIVKSYKDVDEDQINKLSDSNDVFIFCFENTPGIRKLKGAFQKNNNCVLVDCYELTKANKVQILNKILEKNDFKLEEEVFWFLIDKLDNRFGVCDQEISKLLKTNKDNLDIHKINKIISKNSNSNEKIFFQIFDKNQNIASLYLEKIVDQNEVSSFFYSVKQYCLMVINSASLSEFEKSVPAYLFREKNFLRLFFNKFNIEKKSLVLSLLLKTEKEIRKNSDQSIMIGFRFLFSLKKIIIS